MIGKIKLWIAAVISIAMTFVSLLLYGQRQKQKAEAAEQENERLTIENQGNIAHIQRTQDALTENAKQQAATEQDLSDGKRDYFERGY